MTPGAVFLRCLLVLPLCAFSTRSDWARSLADDTKAVWGLIASQVLHCTVVPEVI